MAFLVVLSLLVLTKTGQRTTAAEKGGIRGQNIARDVVKFLYATSIPLINAQGLVQIMQLSDVLLPVSFTRLHIHETPCVPDLITSIFLFKYFCML